MADQRINPETGVLEEDRGGIFGSNWQAVENDDGNEQRVNQETGVLEEDRGGIFGSNWQAVENDDGNEQRVNQETGVLEEDRGGIFGSNWQAVENDDGNEQRANPETGVLEEDRGGIFGSNWQAVENDAGNEQRANPATGVFEEDRGGIFGSNWQPDESRRSSPLRGRVPQGSRSGNTSRGGADKANYESEIPSDRSGPSPSSGDSPSLAEQPASSPESAPGIGVLVAAIILAGVVTIIVQHGGSSDVPPVPVRVAADAPSQVMDRGACPYEACRYGERWLARKDANVYIAPPAAPGMTTSMRILRVMRAGQWATTDTGVIVAMRHDGEISSDASVKVDKDATYSGRLFVQKGQPVALYSSLGEGCWTAWIDKHFLSLCNATSKTEARSEWWVQLRLEDGTIGWVSPASRAFVSQEGLDSEMGDAILAEGSSLPDKLRQVDSLLKEGANFTDGGGKYGTDPVEAVVRTKDVNLLKELISRGLNLRSGAPCVAYWAAQNAQSAEGVEMLEILLDNGMPLTCLDRPIHEFLAPVAYRDDFPLDVALKVAALLVRQGANVNERDYQGKTIFDVLDHGKDPSRVVALKELLLSESMHTTVDESDRVLKVGSGVSAPVVLFKVDPEYSDEARAAHLQGTVTLSLVVDRDGRAQSIRVIHGLGLGLDEKAIAAIKNWRFQPGSEDGLPVSVSAQIEVSFKFL